jgi:TPR repeat protein
MDTKDNRTEHVSAANSGRAIEEIRNIAEQGNTEAKYYYGCALFWGRGVEHNPEGAKQYFIDAANEGDKNALKVVFYLYHKEILGKGAFYDEVLAKVVLRILDNEPSSRSNAASVRRAGFPSVRC